MKKIIDYFDSSKETFTREEIKKISQSIDTAVDTHVRERVDKQTKSVLAKLDLTVKDDLSDVDSIIEKAKTTLKSNSQDEATKQMKALFIERGGNEEEFEHALAISKAKNAEEFEQKIGDTLKKFPQLKKEYIQSTKDNKPKTDEDNENDNFIEKSKTEGVVIGVDKPKK